MDNDLRQKLERVIRYLEMHGALMMDGANRLPPSLGLTDNELRRLWAAGWILVAGKNGDFYAAQGQKFFVVGPGPAWWNDKQKEHAQQLADASERLNKTIQRLTQWGVGISFAALIWSIASFGIEQGWW